MVGVRLSLPVPGVALLLGNGLAGSKIMVNPCVSCNPQLSSVQEEVLSAFPSCANTRAIARKKEESLTVRVDGYETPCSDAAVEVYSEWTGT